MSEYTAIYLILHLTGAAVAIGAVWHKCRRRKHKIELAVMTVLLLLGGIVGWIALPQLIAKRVS